MSTSYIPEGTYAVCTCQMGASPQKLIASRDKISVFHKDKPLLTVADKNLDIQFTCKSPVSIAAALLAFGAGLVVGALLLSNPIGWIVAGCLVATVGVAYTIKAINHQCTSPMKTGSWAFYHKSVTLDGKYAITQVSLLSCSNGGILTPFFSHNSACAAAKRISNNNLAEIGVNVVISFFGGSCPQLLVPRFQSTAF